MTSKDNFDALADEVYRYQLENNVLFQTYAASVSSRLGREKAFLPIRFFKSHRVSCHDTGETVFTSSGTTGPQTSKHPVHDLEVYRHSFLKGFTLTYGSPYSYCFLALLPSYLEREGSSLVYMVNGLIKKSKYSESGFFLHDYGQLNERLISLRDRKIPTILLGVSFALLDFNFPFEQPFPELIVMETGGMKGRRRELVRKELHQVLKDKFLVPVVHSEYGMTELFSQAYAKGNGQFRCPPWMRVQGIDISDPLTVLPPGRRGRLAIIDLANVDSCSFIATDDLGVVNEDGSFTVEGRLDHSDIRGCNLLYN